MKVFNTILPLILLVIGIFLPLNYFFIIVISYLIVLFFTNRLVLYRLKSKYFISFLAILMVFYPMFGEQNDLTLPLNIGYDFNYLELSVRMSLRAILLFGFSNILMINLPTSKLLSKFNMQNSTEAIDIAMNNYDEIARKTLERFKSFNYKKFKLSKSIDYIAIFMADLLTYRFQDRISSTKTTEDL